MCTFSCVLTFTGLLACPSVLDLEYSHFLLEYPPIRAWPISKWNLNWSYLFTEVWWVEFSLYSKNEFTMAASIRKKNIYFHAFLEFLPTLYILLYKSNMSINPYEWLYWWATRGWGILCLDEPSLLTQCVATVGCDNVERNFTRNFPVSFQAVAVTNLLFLFWNVLCSQCCIFGGFWNKDGKFFLFAWTVPAASMSCLFKWIERGYNPETPSNFWNNLKVTPLDDTPPKLGFVVSAIWWSCFGFTPMTDTKKQKSWCRLWARRYWDIPVLIGPVLGLGWSVLGITLGQGSWHLSRKSPWWVLGRPMLKGNMRLRLRCI